jgi:multidrug transporter EmrE-like cation transporter
MGDLDWLGIALAILAGVLNFSGTVMQKKVINDLPADDKEKRFFGALVRKPLWILGLCCQLAFGAVLQMLATDLIGPTLPPGLMAVGLVVLAIGSVKVVHESLKGSEIFGIFLMIVAIFLLGFSDLEINATIPMVIDSAFILRATIFTVICLSLIITFYLKSRHSDKARGTLLVTASGCFFGLSNFWISPLMTTFPILAGDLESWIEIPIFIASCVFLIMTNTFGTGLQQSALKSGQASTLITVQQIPSLVAPVFYYFAVFELTPTNPTMSISFITISIILAVISTFLLSKRQVMLEEIK